MQQTTRTSEYDFGVFDYEGTSIMFKTDYYDKELDFSLAWSRRSHRHRAGVITIMRILTGPYNQVATRVALCAIM